MSDPTSPAASLQELAERATRTLEAVAEYDSGDVVIPANRRSLRMKEIDARAAFAKEATPAAVLALIAERDEARAEQSAIYEELMAERAEHDVLRRAVSLLVVKYGYGQKLDRADYSVIIPCDEFDTLRIALTESPHA